MRGLIASPRGKVSAYQRSYQEYNALCKKFREYHKMDLSTGERLSLMAIEKDYKDILKSILCQLKQNEE